MAIKGKQIKLECRRSLNTYTNKNGVTVNDWNITVDKFEMVDAAAETPQTAATATKEVRKMMFHREALIYRSKCKNNGRI